MTKNQKKRAEKVAYLKTIGWVVVANYTCPARTVLQMGDRCCTVDHFGRVRERNADYEWAPTTEGSEQP